MATTLTLPDTNGFLFLGCCKNKVYKKNPKTVNNQKITRTFMTHSEKLMKIEISAALCVRVFWTGVNMAMLVEDI